MKKLLCLLLLITFILGCQDQQRENELQKREATVAQKEQTLQLKENELVLREKKLLEKENDLDSANNVMAIDTVYNRIVGGTWAVKMNCIETSCLGSAIGDVKNEQWEITNEEGKIAAKAFVNKKQVRQYTGSITANALEMTVQHMENETLPDAQMTVRLQMINDRRLEGKREIVRSDNCKIVYALELTKK
ncbi:hypothetical protein [Tellurirhabdus bombi]|uniref:hypothetical protein n=1 Tax=Tellurirhabdus bombi TaxID=2907205 RepID=UPI001F27BA82|nr:hypothetical protein [Tellurirhabdus bombi]